MRVHSSSSLASPGSGRQSVAAGSQKRHGPAPSFSRPPLRRSSSSPSSKPQPRTNPALAGFTQAWLPQLLDQQAEAQRLSEALSRFGERVASEMHKAQSQLTGVMQGVLVSPARPKQALTAARRGLSAGLLDAPAPPTEPLPDHLAAIVAQVQATNQSVRALQDAMADADASLAALTAGADARDEQTAAYRDALLALADDLEAAEREAAAAAAEAAAREAEEARRVAEARRLEEARREEQLRRELEELVAAASAVQAAQAGLAVAQTSEAALVGAPPIKVEVGVHHKTKLGQQLLLVGSHPSLGSWHTEGALEMQWTDGHVWKASIELPASFSEPLEYKAVLRSGDKYVWERGSNHSAEVGGSSDVSLYHVFKA